MWFNQNNNGLRLRIYPAHEKVFSFLNATYKPRGLDRKSTVIGETEKILLSLSLSSFFHIKIESNNRMPQRGSLSNLSGTLSRFVDSLHLLIGDSF